MEKKKFKLWKIILIIIACILLLAIIFTLRNVMILNKLQNKILAFEKNNNVYSKVDSEISTIENFILGDNSKIVMKFKDKPLTSIQIKTGNDYKDYLFYEAVNKVSISNNSIDNINAINRPKVENFAETFGFLHKIIKSITSKIYTEKIEGKEYYVIENKDNNKYIILQEFKGSKAYIDKETGLPFKLVKTGKRNDSDIDIKEYTTNFTYNTDVVTDNDLIKPNIEKYELMD